MTNEEIQEIIAKAEDNYDRLKDRVHEQYDEIERLKEEYVMLQNASDEVEEDKNKEIARLTAESTKWESKFYDEAKKVDRAIEYIETHQLNFKKGTTTFGSERLSMEERKLIDILRGVDKE